MNNRTSKSVDLAKIDTPLARMLHTHILQQCAPFIEQYNNALELDALRMHQLQRKQRVNFCIHSIMEKLNTKCSNRVLIFQNAIADIGPDPSKASAAQIEKYKEAEGRLQFCARYPHPVNREAQNERPVTWYFQKGSASEEKKTTE